jgi:hypothetical protein
MRSTVLGLVLLIITSNAFAQKDSSMKLDLGISKGQNVYLWPLIRVKKAPGYKNTEIFFSIFQKKQNRNKKINHSHLLPLYYLDSNRRHRDIKIGTLYYPSVYSYRNNFVDSIRTYKFFELAPGISLVEGSRSSDGMFIQNNALFFLWSKRDIKKQKAYTILFPVYWSFQNGPKEFKTAFPVYWSYKNKDINNKVLFPIIYKFRDTSYSSFTVLPLFSYGKSPSGNKSHQVITPLFWQIKDSVRFKQALFPFYSYSKTGMTRSKDKTNYFYQDEILNILLLYSKQTTYSFQDTIFKQSLFPVYWKFQNKNESRLNVLPVYYSYKNSKKSSIVVFPVYYHRHLSSDNSSLTAVTPFFWHKKTDRTQRFVAFPIYWFNQKEYKTKNGSITHRDHTIFPLWYSRSIIGESPQKFQFLFPLFVRKSNWLGYSSITLISVFSYGKSVNQKRKHLQLTPFFWYFKTENQKKAIFFPFYWYKIYNYNSPNKRINHTLFPIYFSRKSARKNKIVLFPLIWYFKNPSRITLSVFPFYYDIKEKNKHQVTLFPLVWYKKSLNNKRIAVLPVFWHEHISFKENEMPSFKTTSALLPFWFSRVRMGKDTQIFKMLFPFYIKNLNGNKYISNTFLGLYSKGNTPDKLTGHFVVSPFYWQFYSKSKMAKVIFPVYWYKKADNRFQNMGYLTYNRTLFPIWFSKYKFGTDTQKLQVFFPVYFKKTNWKHKNSITIFPFYHYGTTKYTNKSQMAITPFFWQFKDPFNKRAFLFPFYWYRIKNVNGGNPTISHSLFPLFYSRTNNNSNRKILFPVFWYKKDLNTRNLSIFPLFFDLKQYNGHKVVLFPIYWYKKELYFGRSTTISHTVFPLYWYKKTSYKKDSIQLVQTNSTLFPIWFSRSKVGIDTQKLQFLLPIYHQKKNWDNYNSLTLFGFLSKGQSVDGKSKHFVVAPLYWQFITPNKESKTLFPLYWYRKTIFFDSTTKQTTTLFPLVWSTKYRDNKGNLTNSSLTVLPFYWAEKSNYHSQVNVIPFYYSYKSRVNTDQSLSIVPIYWNIKNEFYTLQAVFPFFLNYKKSPAYSFGFKSVKSVTPLYWELEKQDKRQKIYFPGLFKTEFTNGDVRLNALGILYRQQLSKTRNSIQILWPLINSTHDSDLRYFHIAPIIWYKKSPKQNYFFIAPFYYKGTINEVKKTQILWQLLNIRKTPQKRTLGILFHIFHFENYTNGDHVYRFMYLLVADIKKNGNIEKSVFPIYYRFSDTAGNKNFNAGFAFYARSSKKIGQTNHFYNEERIFWIVRLRSNYKYLKSKGVVKNRKELR